MKARYEGDEYIRRLRGYFPQEPLNLERVLKSHLNHSGIPQAPHSGLEILRERLTVRIHVYRNQRTEVARLQIALDSSASIRTTVDVRVPERTYIEDLEAILKIMALLYPEILSQSDVGAHEVRLANAVPADVAILVSGRLCEGRRVEPVEDVALEVCLLILGAERAEDSPIRITYQVGPAEVGAHAVLTEASESRKHGFGHS